LALFRFHRKVEVNIRAGATKSLGIHLWQKINPAIASFTAKALHQFLERRHDRLEIIHSEVGPRVIVNGLVDTPLFYSHNCVAGAKELLSLRREPFFFIFLPRL
jgi:hypothetical protein